MEETKRSVHSKSSIILTDGEEVAFASLFSDMFADSSASTIVSNAALSASKNDHRGATSVEFIFGGIQMHMHANSNELTKLQGHISALIWRSSLLASSIICGCTLIPKLQFSSNLEFLSRFFGNSQCKEHRLQGFDVLELGCGRALAGKVCSTLGANRVVLTDCDDRALQRLKSEFRDKASGHECFCEIHHLLWEREQQDAEWAAQVGAPFATSNEAPLLPIRHWADAYRLIDEFADLGPAQFDFVIASDCLYFHVQEEPLAATLRRRLKKPDGIGFIIVETRGNGAFQLERFLDLLRSSGFGTVMCDSGPWDFDHLLQQHIRKDMLVMDAPCVATTGHEQNGPHVILVSWR
jgi:predicted nicotinamide N-methyase